MNGDDWEERKDLLKEAGSFDLGAGFIINNC